MIFIQASLKTLFNLSEGTHERESISKLRRGLEEVKAYLEGEREGYKVSVPPSVYVKSTRKGLNMTQAAFSDSFGFSLDTVHWEGGRQTLEVPARTYLTVIQRNLRRARRPISGFYGARSFRRLHVE